ncbi:hypothetical protein [Thiomonas sp.]
MDADAQEATAPKEYVVLTAKVPVHIWARWKEVMRREGRRHNEVLLTLIEDYLKRNY